MFFDHSKKELQEEVERLRHQNLLLKEKLIEALENSKVINATCMTRQSGEPNMEIVKECLCTELAKQLMSRNISIQSYKMVDAPWDGEYKHIATIRIIEK